MTLHICDLATEGVALDFYKGKVLRVDLSSSTAVIEPQRSGRSATRRKGQAASRPWEYVPEGRPWSPENPVILMTGPLAAPT
jgi:aldehyde:ferredoxin oxidoreductase